MPNEQQVKHIKELIQSLQGLIDVNDEDATTPIHDYPTLRDTVIRMEIRSEIAKLNELINSPETFETSFKERCAERALQNEGTLLDFCASPTSLINKLYWDIALNLFHPSSLTEMLHILLPQVSQSLQISFSDNLPIQHSDKDVRQHMRELLPSLNVLPLESDSTELPPDLSHFVIVNKTIFDVRQISKLPFRIQAYLYDELRKDQPALAKELYTHNDELRTLATHIELLHNRGQTPREALQRLVDGLRLGGATIGGTEDLAGYAAQVAYERFFSYWDALPEGFRQELDELQNSASTLKKFLDELRNGQCVESAAGRLTDILMKKNYADLLDKRLALSNEEKRDIEQKYHSLRRKGIETSGASSSVLLPKNLLDAALSMLVPVTNEDWITLFLNFPLDMYETLLRQVAPVNRLTASNMLLAAIRQGIYNAEQRQAIGDLLVKDYSLWGGFAQALLFAYAAGMEDVFLDIWQSAPDESTQIRMLLQENEIKRPFFLELANSNPPLFLKLLNTLSEKQRIIVREYVNPDNKRTLLHIDSIYTNQEVLEAVLKLYEEDESTPITELKDVAGEFPLYLAARANLLAFTTILNRYPDNDEKYKAVRQLTRYSSVLCGATYSEDSFEILKICFSLFPNDIERVTAIQQSQGHSVNPSILNVKNVATLQFLLSFYPNDDERRRAIERVSGGRNLLQALARYPDCVEYLLSFYPSDELKLQIVIAKSRGGSTAAELSGDMLPTILRLFTSENSRMSILKSTVKKSYDSDEQTLLQRIVEYNTEQLNRINEFLPSDNSQNMISTLCVFWKAAARTMNVWSPGMFSGPNIKEAMGAATKLKTEKTFLEEQLLTQKSYESMKDVIIAYLTDPNKSEAFKNALYEFLLPNSVEVDKFEALKSHWEMQDDAGMDNLRPQSHR